MTFEVELISRRSIKPSSPTPHHLRHYPLSFLDQLCPPVYYNLAFFYPPTQDKATPNNLETFQQLEQSLSHALNLYYPLAGRLKDNLYVDCNDQGVLCLQAQAKCRLSQVLEDPIAPELMALFPSELDDARVLLVGVQLTTFECGGIGAGVCISHKIGDASSFFTFIKTWAAIARGETDLPRPDFQSSTLFPAKDLSGYNYDPSTSFTKDKIVAKRFLFTSESIKTLAEEVKHHEHIKASKVQPCTPEDEIANGHLQVLTAFLWNRVAAATDVKLGTNGFYQLLHLLNLRPRMNPPLPENAFGNNQWVATTILPPKETKEDENPSELVRQMRGSMSKIDGGFVKMLQEEGEKMVLALADEHAKKELLRGEGVAMRVTFSSLCKVGAYEADFGRGKPVWAGLLPGLKFENQVVFMDTATGEGVEVLVLLKEEDMIKFQEDKKLLAFVATNPCFKETPCPPP